MLVITRRYFTSVSHRVWVSGVRISVVTIGVPSAGAETDLASLADFNWIEICTEHASYGASRCADYLNIAHGLVFHSGESLSRIVELD